MDYTSVSLRLHAPCRDRDKMNCILWLYSRSFFFLFSSNLNACFPLLRSVVWMWDCFCLWTTWQTVHHLFFSLWGLFQCILVLNHWVGIHRYTHTHSSEAEALELALILHLMQNILWPSESLQKHCMLHTNAHGSFFSLPLLWAQSFFTPCLTCPCQTSRN